MKIKDLLLVKFVDRPNRFTVIFSYHGAEISAHLKDPGRLKELLIPGVDLLVKKAPPNPNRKTKYDVIAVCKDKKWVLINSGYHSQLAADLIKANFIPEIRPYQIKKKEYGFGKSRLDFLLELKENDSSANSKLKLFPEKMLLEVKGCTLAENKKALFPDAPTIRGKKHLKELISGIEQGFASAVIFLIMVEDAEIFSPNFKTDPEFSQTLIDASKKGVIIKPIVFKTRLKVNCLIIKPFNIIEVNF